MYLTNGLTEVKTDSKKIEPKLVERIINKAAYNVNDHIILRVYL